jgi:uncharacterized 2Fe-2S/4Fe-4S cluster protein (DUF4445 family)
MSVLKVVKMGEITIVFQPYGKRVRASEGDSVLDSARKAGVNIRNICGGKGECGKCKVVIKKGKANFRYDKRKRLLTEGELAQGHVLACSTFCESDCEVLIPPESRIEGQKMLSHAEIPEIQIDPPAKELLIPQRSFGLALDIGTTKVTAYLVNLTTGEIVGTESDYNRQLMYGEDLVSRIGYTVDREDGTKDIQKAVLDTINDLIKRLAANHGVESNQIIDVCAAGNTVMTYFFLGRDASPLLDPDVEVSREPASIDAKLLGLEASPYAKVYCLPCVSRFLGGDTVGDILLSGMHESDGISLLLDIGTNVGAIFGSRDWFLSTTAAAGPAFEGWGIKFGVRSVEGAIDRVQIDPTTLKANFKVIGDVRPKGICGSGLIDVMAEMLRNNILDSLGRINRKLDSPYVRKGDEGYEYVVVPASETDFGKDIVVTEKDILNLIDSKAAACSAVSVMMKKMNLSVSDVARVFVCGAFANYMDLNSAVTIGLLPEFTKARVKFLGNGAVAGAYLTLVSQGYRERAVKIAELMTYFDLLKDADFMDEYTAAYVLPGKRELFPTWWGANREK